jgi:NTP pyrophosphatase (non-canonical NTP hydrolase)
MDLAAFQQLMETTYGRNDRQRGVPATVAWLAEEVGELAQAVRKGTREEQEHEFADVLAWLASLANQMGIDLAAAADRYANGCPRCGASPCRCDHGDEWGSPSPGFRIDDGDSSRT